MWSILIDSILCTYFDVVKTGYAVAIHVHRPDTLFDTDGPSVLPELLLQREAEATNCTVGHPQKLRTWENQFILDVRVLSKQRLDEQTLSYCAVGISVLGH